MIATFITLGIFVALYAAARYGLRLWRGLRSWLSELAGADPEWRPTGLLRKPEFQRFDPTLRTRTRLRRQAEEQRIREAKGYGLRRDERRLRVVNGGEER